MRTGNSNPHIPHPNCILQPLQNCDTCTVSTSNRCNRMLAHQLQLPTDVDVVFFGGETSHLLLHALHVALAEFGDAGYIVLASDAAAVHAHSVASYIESHDISSCSPLLSFRPHTLAPHILNDPVFTGSSQSSLSSSAFASLDDAFLGEDLFGFRVVDLGFRV